MGRKHIPDIPVSTCNSLELVLADFHFVVRVLFLVKSDAFSGVDFVLACGLIFHCVFVHCIFSLNVCDTMTL